MINGTKSNGNVQNWLMGIFAVIVIGLSSFALNSSIEATTKIAVMQKELEMLRETEKERYDKSVALISLFLEEFKHGNELLKELATRNERKRRR